MKRYILPFDVWDERLTEIIKMIGKSRKEGRKWGGLVDRKEMRRLAISGNHYMRQGYSGFKVTGIVRLWEDETGEKGLSDILNFKYPYPPY